MNISPKSSKSDETLGLRLPPEKMGGCWGVQAPSEDIMGQEPWG